jgi:hypothetical protein
MIRIGIDPGASGAIAWITPEGGAEIHDMPIMPAAKTLNAAGAV